MKYLISFFILLITTMGNAQTQNYDTLWKDVEKDLENNLTETALKKVQNIYSLASKSKNENQIFKSVLYRAMLAEMNKEDFEENFIQNLEKQDYSKNPLYDAFLSLLIANCYNNYYDEHSWEIMNRTETEDVSDDMKTWDATKFDSVITYYYLKALKNKGLLQQAQAKDYKFLLNLGSAQAQKDFPTVYDVFCKNAFDYFNSQNSYMARTGNQMSILDPALYTLSEKFVAHTFDVTGGGKEQQAIQILQDWESFKLSSHNDPGLVRVWELRTEFANQHYFLDNKTTLYEQCVRDMSLRYDMKRIITNYLYTHVQSDYSFATKIIPISTDSIDRVEVDAYLKKTHSITDTSDELYNELVNHINELEAKKISLESENVVLPNNPFLVRVEHRNVNLVNCTIYKLNRKEWKNVNEDSKWKTYKTVNEFSVSLDPTWDLKDKSTEFKVDGLGTGYYVIIAKDADKKISHMLPFVISNLVTIPIKQDNQYAISVLDRTTGQPISGAKVTISYNKYQNSTVTTIVDKIMNTNGQGIVIYPFSNNSNSNYQILVSKGSDEYESSTSLNTYRYGRNDQQTHKEYIYTDRAIYRPGQIVNFNILAIKKLGLNSSELRKNWNTKITLYDANSQVVEEKTILTNEYGTASGLFHLPEGRLNGNYYLQTSDGYISFQVEEYKRPKFKVEIMNPKNSQTLNDTVDVMGTAKTYAGANVGQAKVVYRVVRNARFPYPWCWKYWGGISSNEKEVAHGETQTNDQGEFRIPFYAEADPQINPKTYPIFDYTIYADVTDVSGETRSDEYRLSLSYLSFYISNNLKSEMDISTDKNIQFYSTNAANQSVEGNVKVQIFLLKPPARLYKDRLWMTDYSLISESDFRKYFPDDEYQNENSKSNWKVSGKVLEKSFVKFQSDSIPLSSLSGAGVYRIQTTSKNGDNTIENEFILTLRDGEKVGNQPVAINSRTNAFKYKVNDKASIVLNTSLKNPFILQLDNHGNRNVNAFVMKDNIKITLPITEKERGSTQFNFMTWYQNRYYTSAARIYVPWTNKELNITLKTFKDKLLPGSIENWEVHIDGMEKEKVKGELMAAMYDMSLDEFIVHQWDVPSLYNDNIAMPEMNVREEIKASMSRSIVEYSPLYLPVRSYEYPDFDFLNSHSFRDHGSYRYMVQGMQYAPEMVIVAGVSEKGVMADDLAISNNKAKSPKAIDEKKNNDIQPPLRKNLQETAFFYPQLLSDNNGTIILKFTMPEALTRWKLMMMGHTEDLAFGYNEKELVTQKELMVTPQLPRYLRQSDQISLAVKVDNLSTLALKGSMNFRLLDAISDQDVTALFGVTNNDQTFDVGATGSTVVNWKLAVPSDYTNPVKYQVFAKTNQHTDGEEGILPVVSNRILVTESMPIQMKGNGEKSFTFQKMKDHQTSTSTSYNYTIEYSGSPVWYAVQSLPYLMDYPYGCAEQTFNKIYATAIASHIAASNPTIKSKLDLWLRNNPQATQSPLEKNPELKSALLEETPWVADAKNESEQIRNLALLFDQNNLSNSFTSEYARLKNLQNEMGGFAWFDGGSPDVYITSYIAVGIGRLSRLHIEAGEELNQTGEKAMKYLRMELIKRMHEQEKNKVKSISHLDIMYLYASTFYSQTSLNAEEKKSEKYFLDLAKIDWNKFNKSTQAMLALVFQRKNNGDLAKLIMKSFNETAIHDPEKGMYWKDFTGGYYWYESPIEGMALMVESYEEVSKDKGSADEQRIWLLKNKQVNAWKSTKATADACYALLYNNQSLNYNPEVQITLGKTVVKSQVEIPGMDYIKSSFDASQIKEDFKNIKVNISEQAPNAISWGGVYWQFFEDMNAVTSDKSNPLNVEKQVYKKVHTANGEKLMLVKENDPLEVGDKLTVRLVIRTDRDMEYVHIKDARAGCVEPIDVISEYHWENNLSYYQSTKDISTNYFCDRMARGTYVLEYDAFVNQRGRFSIGMATVQCMYAPEYGAHSQGGNLLVK